MITAKRLAEQTKKLAGELKQGEYFNVYNQFKETLDKNLEYERFCCIFAELITFSLFLERLGYIKGGLEKIMPFVSFDDLELDCESLVKEIDSIDLEILKAELGDKDFYEQFLSEFDGDLRKERGVYYTPEPIVKFIIRAVDSVLIKELGCENGLGDDKVRLLDFCCGTGSFLLEALRVAFGRGGDGLEKRFGGYEIMFAPFFIAYLKSLHLFKEYGVRLDDERLNIYLTNTLYNLSVPEDEQKGANIFTRTLRELNKEFVLAKELKEKEILIITGNPPYSSASANKGLFENEVKNTYGLEPNTKEKLKNEKNTKVLLDDYVKFMRFAESKLEKQEQGIFALISNHGFLDNPTFRGMRFHLLNTFEKIYIIDLHGNLRQKEKTLDGGKDENVFDIQQGVSISVFIKTGKKQNSELAKVFHYDLFGERQEKYKFLLENNLKSIQWNILKPQKTFYLFIPQNEKLMTEYNKGWEIKNIFILSNSAIKTGRDDFCISKSNTEKSLQEFKEKIKKFINFEAEFARIEFNLGADARDWQIELAKKDLKETNNNPNNYIKIQYRPFDIRWTYFTGKAIGFMSYPRNDVMQFLLDNKNMGLIYKRGFPNLDSGQCFISNTITDLRAWSCAGMKGTDFISPLYLDASKITKKDLFGEQKNGMIENFTPDFRAFIDSKYQEHFTPETILGYIYATLYHKSYRQKYIDFLKIDFPKIHFVDDKGVFLKMSELGNALIALHLMEKIPAEKSHIGKSQYDENVDKAKRHTTITKIAYKADSKRLYVNETLYFANVEQAVWEYKIGSYQVLDKYLKSHKGEDIDFIHFKKVIQILSATLDIEKQIEQIKIF